MEAAESFHRLVGLFDKHGSQISPRRRELHGLRDLDRSTDLGFFLFGLFNPVVTSMRALCAATHLRRVSKVLDLEGPVAISGFSDAQHVFAPEILEPVLKELLIESLAKQTSPAKSNLPIWQASSRPNPALRKNQKTPCFDLILLTPDMRFHLASGVELGALEVFHGRGGVVEPGELAEGGIS